MQYEYKNIQSKHIRKIAELCSDCFDASLPWYQPFAKGNQIKEYESHLIQRYEFVKNGFQHCMIGCFDEQDNPIGFVEIGMLPRPMPVMIPTQFTCKNPLCK